MAFNQDAILSNNFIFVSYSHQDAEAVKADVTALLRRGVRVWYDDNMRIGDKWTEIADRVIHHENCIGILFYNSPHAFVSSAVQLEQQWAAERYAANEIKVWAVHMDEKPTAEICTEVLAKLSAEKGNITDYFAHAMPLQQMLFDTRCLCLMRADHETTVDRIYREIAEPYGVVDNEKIFIEEADKKTNSSRGTSSITLGRYIGTEYFGPEQPSDTADQRFGLQQHLIQINGKRYSTKELQWQLLYVKDGKAILLCTQILDQMSFGEGLSFLSDTFPSVAFSPEERERGNISARYMTEEDVALSTEVHTEAALMPAPGAPCRHWWIDAAGMTGYWKKTYSNDFLYHKGFSIFVKKGIRPILEISNEFFRK